MFWKRCPLLGQWQISQKIVLHSTLGIAEYLSLVKGCQDIKKKVHLSEKIHPFVWKSINIINNYYFEEYALTKTFLEIKKAAIRF